MITHTIESYWIPSQKMTKSKLQILKIRQNCLIRCANMKWIRWVLLKIQSGHDSVHRRTDGQGDTSIPPYQLRWSGGYNDMIQVVVNTFWEFREIYAKSHLPFYKVVVVMIVIVSCKHCDLFYMISHTVPPLSNTNANDIAYFSNGIANKGAHLNNVSEQISVAMQNTSSRYSRTSL